QTLPRNGGELGLSSSEISHPRRIAMKVSRRSLSRVALTAVLATSFFATAMKGDSPRPTFIGLGDSIGEAVQSADANLLTQPNSYLNLIATQMRVSFPLPLIRTTPTAAIFSTQGRSRVDPSVQSLNLAVSGANAHSLLFERADAAGAPQIDSETDMVLF